jgi:hypothetical protein
MPRSYEVKHPQEMFSNWHYDIIKAHWNTLGIVSTWLIDKARTDALREELVASGMPKEEATKRMIKRFAYVDRCERQKHLRLRQDEESKPEGISSTDCYSFAEGYVFLSKDGQDGIQILAVDDESVDVCSFAGDTGRFRAPYRLPKHELVDWLRTGRIPVSRMISRYEVTSEIMRLAIPDDASEH